MSAQPTKRNGKVLTGVLVIAATAAFLLGTSQTASAQQLHTGHARTVSGGWHTRRYFYVDVPEHTRRLVIQTSGGFGNADIFAKRNPPGVGAWTHQSRHGGNHERIEISHPHNGRWWIMVYAHGAYHNVSLIANYEVRNRPSLWEQAAGSLGPIVIQHALGGSANGSSNQPDDDDDDDRDGLDVRLTTLQRGISQENLRSRDDRCDIFRINVPEGATNLTLETLGGRGECVLLVRRGALPSLAVNDYASGNPGTRQLITIATPAGGAYYVTLIGAHKFRGVTLMADYKDPTGENSTSVGFEIIPLENGAPRDGLAATAGDAQYFMVHFPDSLSALTFTTTGGEGNCTLFVRRNAIPTQDEFDCSAGAPGTNQTIDLGAAPAVGTYYIMLCTPDGYENISLKANGTP